MYHSFLIHSFADGHLGCFHVLAIIILYTNNEKTEREIKETIPFTIATKNKILRCKQFSILLEFMSVLVIYFSMTNYEQLRGLRL